MLRHLLSLALVAGICASSVAQNASPFQLVSQTETEAVVKVTPSAPTFQAVQTPSGVQYKVGLQHGTAILEKGFPDLDKLTTSLACPEGKIWVVSSVETGAYTEFDKTIAPS